MRQSMLPPGGANLFQKIKRQCKEAEAADIQIFRLTIGQPTGPALRSAREAAAIAVRSSEETMHEYQDNGSPGVKDFARRFVLAHLPNAVAAEVAQLNSTESGIDYLPLPGTKPILGQVIQACGQISDRTIRVATMTNPGYPTPAVQAFYLGADHYALDTTPENKFLFSPAGAIRPGTQVVMTNYPHNPTGQIATIEFWWDLCQFCSDNNIRLFNDAAYAILSHAPEACTLTEAALAFPNLSWAEAFSASKVIANGTGWRVGALVGSSDFVGDIATIKGNTDSGFVAFAAAGVIHCMEKYMDSIRENSQTYKRRLDLLCGLLEARGMRPAVSPSAGFFTLWLTPKQAFGQEIKDAAEFNELMIQNTGVVGVPFGRYIRYAVTNPIEKQEWQDAIIAAFDKAEVKY